jgi:hypothetical protein
MIQILEVLSNAAPLFDSAPRPAANPGVSVRAAGIMIIAACLLTLTLNPACADATTTGFASVAEDKLPIDDEESDVAEDDGSRALRDKFKVYNLDEIEPISAKEEEALLGNWGDTDAEDGD